MVGVGGERGGSGEVRGGDILGGGRECEEVEG